MGTGQHEYDGYEPRGKRVAMDFKTIFGAVFCAIVCAAVVLFFAAIVFSGCVQVLSVP